MCAVSDASGRSLRPDEREFFSRVVASACANPFSETRERADAVLLGSSRALERDERLPMLAARIQGALAALETEGRATLASFSGADHECMRIVFVFDALLRFYDPLTTLCEEQERAGDALCRPTFAEDVLSLLERRGFVGDEPARLLALLFQLRRAYYFVDQRLTGCSSCMSELRRQLWDSVVTHDVRWYERYLVDRMEDFATLFLGETGVGKGAAAAALGRSGFIPFDVKKGTFVESFRSAFVSINLSQYPEPLIESELFGHRKGAFTGAMEEHDGVLSLCSRYGAVLLDEIGEVSVPVQIKLLRVLQERTFTALGSHQPQRFSGRVMAATNRTLDDLRGEGGFRDDFFYRLCSNIITVPPLRQRLQEDPMELDELVAHALDRMTGERAPQLLDYVRESIKRCVPEDYEWPGNVRELEQCVRRILLSGDYRPAVSAVASSGVDTFLQELRSGTLTSREALAGYCAWLYERHGSLAEVARRTELDRRTVKRYLAAEGSDASDADEAD